MKHITVFPGKEKNVLLVRLMGPLPQTFDYKKCLALCEKIWMILGSLGRMSNVLEIPFLI